MSKRVITKDPIVERQKAYKELTRSNEAQKAIWEALELLNTRGIDIGLNARKILEKRSDIKKRIPK